MRQLILYRCVDPKDNPRKWPALWTLDYNIAKKQARERSGKVVTAIVLNSAGLLQFTGNSPDLARRLGIYDRCVALRQQGHIEAADRLLARRARFFGYAIQIKGNGEVIVFGPRVINIIEKEQLALTADNPF